MTDRELLAKARSHALGLLERVDHYPYHNVGHTLDVYARTAYLADCEGIGTEEKTDLLVAALFHDTGFTAAYPQNEPLGADLAEAFLRAEGISAERIVRVRRIILATIVFSTPGDLLEKIIQDADLDNLGREDCFLNLDRVNLELQTISNAPFDLSKSLAFAEKLLSDFSYRTETAKREREERKQKNLEAFRMRYR
jgi:predicted metal-dependent HD superfamily phosphohydrolase